MKAFETRVSNARKAAKIPRYSVTPEDVLNTARAEYQVEVDLLNYKEARMPFPKLRAKLARETETYITAERRTMLSPFEQLFGFYEDYRVVGSQVCCKGQPLYPLREFWIRSFAGTAKERQ